MVPQLEQLQAEMLERISARSPWRERMALPRVRADLEAVTASVLSRFVRLIGTSAATFDEQDRARLRDVGAGEAREGRGLEELLAAYRIGTRILYTALARELAALDASPEAQVTLGEAMFVLADALQGESAEGYAQEISTHTGERERRLRRLADALFGGEEESVRVVAAQVGWTVPGRVAVVLLPIEALPEARGVIGSLGVVVERDSTAVAVLPADHRLDPALERLAGLPGGGRRAVRVGPDVPLLEARRSLALAALLPEEADGVVRAADRLPGLLVRAAPEVEATLAERALAPLASLPGNRSERLAATLAAWLRHWGQRTLVAAELGVHPQTVGYRMNQLREVFGDALDDPDRRLELQLALLRGRPGQSGTDPFGSSAVPGVPQPGAHR